MTDVTLVAAVEPRDPGVLLIPEKTDDATLYLHVGRKDGQRLSV